MFSMIDFFDIRMGVTYPNQQLADRNGKRPLKK
jgi:hypothetical protein